MIELIMVYCLSGEPCITETLAIFPQEDVGAALCEIARPAITDAIRAKVSAGVSVTLTCDDQAPEPPSFQPGLHRDERYRMIDASNAPTVDIVLDAIGKFIK